MGKIIAGAIVLVVSFLATSVYIFHSVAAIGMLIGVGLIVWGAIPKMPNANSKAESEYIKTAVVGGTKFDIRPARIPFPVGAAIFVVIACTPAVLFFSFGVNLPSIGILSAIFGVAMLLFIWKGGPASKYREAKSFVATPNGIEINGSKLPASDIHRLILRNHVDGSQIAGPSFQGPVVAYDMSTATGAVAGSAYALTAGVAMAGSALRRRRENMIRLIAYRLDAEAGGKATTLACGMDETTAYGLMTDVANILGMR